jgi:hypothetical protein
MFLGLSALGIGIVSGWSLSFFRMSARNAAMCVVALSLLAMETKLICRDIPIALLFWTMIATSGFRFLIRALLCARNTPQT